MNKNSALIIIDMQNDFIWPMVAQCTGGTPSFIQNIKDILYRFRKFSLPVFHVVREYRADGSDIEAFRMHDFLTNRKYCISRTKGCDVIDELRPAKGEYRIIKNRFSSFMNTELDLILRRLDVKDIVICGTQYPNCIRTTIYDAVALGYNVVSVTDATGANSKEVANANIHDISNIGVSCISTDQLLS